MKPGIASLAEVLPAGTRVAVEVLASNEAGRRLWLAAGFHGYSL